MKLKAKLSVILFFAMAVVCLLSSSAMAAGIPESGGARTAPTRLDFLFDKDACALPAAQTAAVERQRFPGLALRLYGGFSRIAAGDMNEGFDGYFEALELYAAMGLGTVTGRYSPVRDGVNFGADLIFQLSPTFGIGLGVGYLRSSKDSLMTFAHGGQEITLTGTPTLSAMPIRLGVFLTLPIFRGVNLTADAGAAYYAGLKFEATNRMEFSADNWQVTSISGSRSDLSANLGFQGSLGLELKLSSKMGFFVEALGRYARFKNFDAVTSRFETNFGDSETEEGKLYIETMIFPERTISIFTVESTPPVDNPPELTFREPKIDLSGFSLQAGIRIRL